MFSIVIVLIFTAFTAASPMQELDDTDYNSASTLIPAITTVSIAGSPSDFPIVWNDDEEPIGVDSYFAISPNCRQDKRDIGNSGFPHRWDFYQQAINDAVLIASSTSDWPLRNIEASDTYFGKGAEQPKYSDDIAENLRVAAHWNMPAWGFDNYIVLTCNDPFQACGGKIGGDSRSVACYVNNTKSWWWNKSYISCCSPFFTTDTIQTKCDQHQHDDPNNLNLQWLQTSGSFLLHEMMHTLEITGTGGQRPHLIDMVWDGTAKRRIYGPKDVAKAARQLGIGSMYLNADSYAQFASCIYWLKRLGGFPQPSSIDNPVPDGYQDLITDNDFNYEEPVLPAEPTAPQSVVTCCSITAEPTET